jgi:hypothetical protein
MNNQHNAIVRRNQMQHTLLQVPTKLDEDKQKAFIENYEKLLNSLGDDEAVL